MDLRDGFGPPLFIGFFLALGACLGMVAFEFLRRSLKVALISLTAAASAVGSWFNPSAKFLKKPEVKK